MGNGHLLTLIFFMMISVSKGPTDSSFKKINKFAFAVLANTQAFYLKSGGDPNDKKVNGEEWKRIGENLVKSLPSDISLGIINGDLTESGWETSYGYVTAVYLLTKHLNVPVYIGLGNRDYQDNVGNCEYMFWKGKDGCALVSMKFLERQVYQYIAADKEVNYTDLPARVNLLNPVGSFSYSWDHKGVHFAQLQNYPTYKTKLMNGDSLRYTIIPSLIWLADDLRMARHRHVSDIILNFHQYGDGFQKNSDDDDQRQFRAIMETYKPLAVFSANETGFIREPHLNHSFYYNTTVYGTGPAFDGKFHLVAYHDGELIVEEWDTITGTSKMLGIHKERRQPPTPICKLPNILGFAGEVYTTEFIPTNLEWNLIPILQPENVVEVEDFGDPSVMSWKKNDSDQAWGFVKANGDVQPEYSSWYSIKHRATNYVLESTPNGRLFLSKLKTDQSLKSARRFFQQWRPIKISKTAIMILNRGANLFLSTDDSGLRAGAGYEISNKAKIWQMKHYIDRSTLNNTRYFKAEGNDSWMNPFPDGDSSDLHWQYLSSHDGYSVPPCIGW